MRIAIVHDWLNQVGGAESVLENLVALYPDAPIYTSIYDLRQMPSHYQQWDIRTSWLDRVPGAKRHHRAFFPLYPLAFESLDLGQYDVVLSNKSGFCHGVITSPETLHICYCLTPTRYVWRYSDYAAREGLSPLARLLLIPVLSRLRVWDRLAADRVDRFIAISHEIQQRIKKYYRRPSEIIYPPVDTSRFTPAASHGEYYLVVGRQVPYKRIDLAVQACTRLGLPLKIGGNGRDQDRLKAMAGHTVEFLGRVPDEDLPALMAGCKAFLFPGVEDFGITPVEVMAAGRPVIAFAQGGVRETVIGGLSGTLFHEQSVEALCEVLEGFDPAAFDPAQIQRHAGQFDSAIFQKAVSEYVTRAWEEHNEWS